tara:strand:+ start:54 stop:581 length:528 start_codon:yes stop_codon:yes gene_type:complete
MLESLITSKTRLKLLLKFFINPSTKAYLRELAKEFDVSTNSIRLELNRLEGSNLLISQTQGRTVQYQANTKNTLFKDIRNITLKYVGIDSLIENIISQLGDLRSAYIIGDYAHGMDTGIIDVVLIGDIDKTILNHLVEKTEIAINRKIKWLILEEVELENLKDTLDISHALKVWG